MTFEVFTAVKCQCWPSGVVNLQVNTSISEKHPSVFTTTALKKGVVCFSETLYLRASPCIKYFLIFRFSKC